MRLGDLDVLKETLSNNEAIRIFNLHYDGLIAEIIDNAPTVPDRTEEVLSLQNTIAKLVEGIAENARSQGEWIKMSDRFGEYYACNVCGYDRANYKSNFCPECGADLRGET